MRNGRIRFLRMLQDAGVADRVRLVYPEVTDGERTTDTMIHSKIFIVDDTLLRVGSANLNNRSMGTDTECDLIFAARNQTQRRAITRIRDKLFGEHCGASAEEVAAALKRTGSLVAVADTLSKRGHRLRPIDDGEPDPDEISATIEEVADPPRPLTEIAAKTSFGARLSRLHLTSLGKISIAAIFVVALTLAWEYTPLSSIANPGALRAALAKAVGGIWAPFVVIGCFVTGGLVAFPVLILIAVTAATFGPVLGFVYASAGCLASAIVTYLIGARLGKDVLRDLLGPRLDRIRRRIVQQGVIAIAAIRMVPIAPFTFVNLVAGASQIRLHDYLLGTILGMAPGILAMSALGHQVFEMWNHPTLANVALLIGAAIGWIALSIGVQVLVSKFRRADS